jgi:chromosome segregation ATPase
MALGTQLPSQIVTKLTPLLTKQLDVISKLADTMASDSMNLPAETSCSDPNVKKIKTDLRKFQNEITRLNSIIRNTSNIVNTIQTITTIAQSAKLSQLIIPAVVGVPQGPITVLINLFTKLVDNAKSAITCLENVLQNTTAQIQTVNSTIADVLNELGSICDTEVFETTNDIADIISQTSLRDLTRYPTKFYNTLNVSDEDIDNRFDTIAELLANQIDVMTNLLEAPSKVLQGIAPPTSELGKVDDYYINLNTNQIFGPKTQTGWGQPVN